MTAYLDAARLRELVTYDPETGIFKRRVRLGNNTPMDAPCGTPMKRGELQFSVDGKNYYAHRLAWLYMTGEWPRELIDHFDTNPGNNRWSNLREAGPTVNCQNRRKPSKANQSGFLGVSPCKSTGRWRAAICVDRKQKQLGRFDTPEQAHAAYLAAKRQLHEGNTL